MRTRGQAPPRGARGLGCRLACALAVVAVLAVQQGCARPPKRPMESMGPWAVGFRRATAVDRERGDRTLPMAIWYPVDPGRAVGKRASYTCFKAPLVTLAVRSDTALWDAPISKAQRWPLIVFSHAAPSLESQSPNYVETLASQGFVVVGPRHMGSTIFDPGVNFAAWGAALDAIHRRAKPSNADEGREEKLPHETVTAAKRGEAWAVDLVGRPDQWHVARPFDVWFTIDWVAEQARSPSSFLHEAVDATRVGVTGHSAGALTCIWAAGGYGGRAPDSRIKAIVPVALAAAETMPDEGMRTITAPALFIVGDRDCGSPWTGDTRRACELISSPGAAIVKIRGASHVHFADIDGFAHRVKSIGLYPWTWKWAGGRRLLRAYREIHAEGMESPYEAQRILNKYAVAFFNLHLKGDARARTILASAHAGEHEPGVQLLTPPFTTSDGSAREADPQPAGDAAPVCPASSHSKCPTPGS